MSNFLGSLQHLGMQIAKATSSPIPRYLSLRLLPKAIWRYAESRSEALRAAITLHPHAHIVLVSSRLEETVERNNPLENTTVDAMF